MRRPTLRIPGVALAATLAVVGMAQATPGTAPGAGTPAHAGRGSGWGGAGGGSSCDPDGVRTSYVVEPTDTTVTAVVVAGIDPACEGQLVSVVLAGIPGEAVVSGAATTVSIDPAVPAAAVDRISVEISPAAGVRPALGGS